MELNLCRPKDTKLVQTSIRFTWMLLFLAIKFQVTKEIGGLIELKLNKVENFLIEETALRQSSMTFRMPSNDHSQNQLYLVVNFNQFRVFRSNPDIPVVKIYGVANNREYLYFSTETPDWTFDEPMLIIPLLNFDLFNIQIEWRDHGFHTTFKGMAGVFSGTSLKTAFGFSLPFMIPPEKAFAEIKLEYPPASELVAEAIVQVKICQGSVSSITLTSTEGLVGELIRSQSNPQLYHLTVQNIHAASWFELKVVASPAEITQTVIAKALFLPLIMEGSDEHDHESSSFLKELTDYKHPAQLAPLGSGSTQITWTNLGYRARLNNYSVKTLFNYGANKADVQFKARCGFCKDMLTKKFPSVEGVESAVFLAATESLERSESYEYAYFAEPQSADTQFSLDLWIERTYRFTEANRPIMMNNHYVVMKEIYSSDNNYRDGTFLLTTITSEVLNPPIVNNNQMEGYSRFHKFTVFIGLTFFLSLTIVLAFLNIKYRRGRATIVDHDIIGPEAENLQSESQQTQPKGEIQMPSLSERKLFPERRQESESPVEDADDEGDNSDI
jgi:hypothetical protein